jgi:hypothetical protein
MSNKPLSGAAAFHERAKKQQEGELLELSSGMVVRVRRPNETKLIQEGHIPAQLAMSSINIQQQKATPADLKNFASLQRLYATLTVVDPVVVDRQTEQDNEVSVDDFDSGELSEIYLYATGGMAGLKQFRQRGQGIPARPDSQALSGNAA